MAIDPIIIGTVANDGTGDPLRTAFGKINVNTSDLDTRVDAAQADADASVKEVNGVGPDTGGGVTIGAGDVGAIPTSEKGAAEGVAELGADGIVPATQLPPLVLTINGDEPDTAGNIDVTAGVWGSITGTLSAQADLQAALDDKANADDVASSFASVAAALAETQPSNTLLSSVSSLAIVAGDLIYGSAANVVARLAKLTDGYVLTLVSGLPTWAAPTGGGRELLTANRTYYVRTDGSDSNNGLANTSGGAFLTIQKAIDTAVALDLGIYAVTINVANGTYTTPFAFKSYVGVGPIKIVGNTGSPSSAFLSVTAADAITADAVLGKWQIAGVKIATVTSGYGLNVKNGSIVEIDSVDFGAASGGYYQIFASKNGSVTAIGNYTISGSAASHWAAPDGGRIEVRSKTITISGTPAFAGSFALAARGGGILALSNTYSGSATGSRYSVTDNATITTGGATLPGSTAGSYATGGQYS